MDEKTSTLDLFFFVDVSFKVIWFKKGVTFCFVHLSINYFLTYVELSYTRDGRFDHYGESNYNVQLTLSGFLPPFLLIKIMKFGLFLNACYLTLKVKNQSFFH